MSSARTAVTPFKKARLAAVWRTDPRRVLRVAMGQKPLAPVRQDVDEAVETPRSVPPAPVSA